MIHRLVVAAVAVQAMVCVVNATFFRGAVPPRDPIYKRGQS